ncbi:MAG: hypothetical protein U0441_28075 [Polyangiaceae bacterium]
MSTARMLRGEHPLVFRAGGCVGKTGFTMASKRPFSELSKSLGKANREFASHEAESKEQANAAHEKHSQALTARDAALEEFTQNANKALEQVVGILAADGADVQPYPAPLTNARTEWDREHPYEWVCFMTLGQPHTNANRHFAPLPHMEKTVSYVGFAKALKEPHVSAIAKHMHGMPKPAVVGRIEIGVAQPTVDDLIATLEEAVEAIMLGYQPPK